MARATIDNMTTVERSEFAYVAESTRETTPRNIWLHSVDLASIRAGVSSQVMRDWHSRTLRAWTAGESVAMAVATLCQVHNARAETPEGRGESVRDHMRSTLKACAEALARKQS